MIFILKHVLLTALLVASAGSEQIVVDFDSADCFTDCFTVVNSSASGTLAYSSSAGAAGVPGRINASVPEQSGKMIYYNQPFSLIEGAVDLSYRFLAEEFTGSSNTRIALGLSPDLVNLRSSARAQVRLINNVSGAATFEIRSAASGSVSTANVVLEDGHWYRLEGSFAPSDTANGVDVSARLIDCGETGSLVQTPVAEAFGTRVDSVLFTSGVPKDLYAGFFAQNDNGGAAAIDEIGLPVFDFREAAIFSNRFEIVAEGAAGSISFSTNAGVGGVSGRLDCTGISSSSGEGLYSEAQIDPDDGAIGASFFFRAEEFVNNGNYSRVALGLSPDQQNLSGNAEVQARLLKSNSSDTAKFEIRGGSGTSSSGVELTDGHWYKFSAVFSPTGSLSFAVNALLEDYGTSGATFVSQVASASAVKTAPSDFFSGKDRVPLSVGLLVQNDGGGGDVIDHIRISVASAVAPSKGENVFSWRNAMGTHYRIYDDAVMGTIRSFPTPSKLSYYPDVTSMDPTEITAVTGHFSGESRKYDFEGVVERENIDHDYGEYIRQAEAAHVDLIWNLGQIHHTHAGHLAIVTNNAGKYYKDLIYEAVMFANSDEFEDSETTVYWEIGNEINSYVRFALQDNGDVANNVTNAADYLEYYLAPAVEAIRAASTDLFGDPDQVKTLLGNITFVRNAATPVFLRTILDGTVVGTHAPTLAGKKGYELVETIGLHYTKGTDSVIEQYYDEWVDSGKINGIWHTEEHGLAALGDYDILQQGLRWMDYWAQKTWSPETARVQFWGDQMSTSRVRSDNLHSDTTGEQMEYFLGQMLQDYPLTRIDSADLTLSATGSPEKYGFWAELPDGGYRGLLLIAEDSDWSLSSVSVPLPGSVKYCEAYIQPVETNRSLWASSWQESGGDLIVTPSASSLRREDEILIIVETQP